MRPCTATEPTADTEKAPAVLPAPTVAASIVISRKNLWTYDSRDLHDGLLARLSKVGGALLVAWAVAACDVEGGGTIAADCPDDAATYACSPVPADEGGCAGIGADGEAVVYPLGCVGTFPGCGGASNPALTCTCAGNVGYGFIDAQAVFVCGN